jgi:hypothetical protein
MVTSQRDLSSSQHLLYNLEQGKNWLKNILRESG